MKQLNLCVMVAAMSLGLCGSVLGKPVKVYILADPSLLSGIYHLHRVDEMKSLDSVTIAHHEVYDAKASGMLVALGTATANLPATSGAQNIVMTAQIDVPGVYDQPAIQLDLTATAVAPLWGGGNAPARKRKQEKP